VWPNLWQALPTSWLEPQFDGKMVEKRLGPVAHARTDRQTTTKHNASGPPIGQADAQKPVLAYAAT